MSATKPGDQIDLTDPALPTNTRFGKETTLHHGSSHPFQRYRSEAELGLDIGDNCTLDGITFNVGPKGSIRMGSRCSAYDCFLISEADITIGHDVVLSFQCVVVDSDFHPLDPTARIKDTIALSPVGDRTNRPEVTSKLIVIEDGAWIGPHAMILKGVRIGAGAKVMPGAIVSRDVPPGQTVIGNPAMPMDEATP